MFGIGGGELIFIIFIALMLFGSDKIPDIARTLGKGMAQLKNATNDIKSEIQKGVGVDGIDTSFKESLDVNLSNPISNASKDIENSTGPIKRQL
jgi:sec-independent protein translocase protein TatA